MLLESHNGQRRPWESDEMRLSSSPCKRTQVPFSYWRQALILIATLVHVKLTPQTACKYLSVQSSLRNITDQCYQTLIFFFCQSDEKNLFFIYIFNFISEIVWLFRYIGCLFFFLCHLPVHVLCPVFCVVYLFIYLFIYGCVGSSFLCEGFL